MNVLITPKFKKAYDKLPLRIQKKTKKAINFLKQNITYPSLRVKKMGSGEDIWEVRVDKFYRMTFYKNEEIVLQIVGPHDEGLGKK